MHKTMPASTRGLSLHMELRRPISFCVPARFSTSLASLTHSAQFSASHLGVWHRQFGPDELVDEICMVRTSARYRSRTTAHTSSPLALAGPPTRIEAFGPLSVDHRSKPFCWHVRTLSAVSDSSEGRPTVSPSSLLRGRCAQASPSSPIHISIDIRRGMEY